MQRLHEIVRAGRLPPQLAWETAARLGDREFCLWIDGRVVVDPDTRVRIDRDSQILVHVWPGDRVGFVEPDFLAMVN